MKPFLHSAIATIGLLAALHVGVSTRPALAQTSPVAPDDPTAQQCQSAITAEINTGHANVERVIYDSSTTLSSFISNAEVGIDGQGQFLRTNAWQDFDYTCIANIREGTLTVSSYTLTTTGVVAPTEPSRAEVCAAVAAMPDADDTDAMLGLLETDRAQIIGDLEATSSNMQQYNAEGYGWQNIIDSSGALPPQPGAWLIGALRMACES
ncbi:hypothetical protein IQ254_13045 [Nodosilinea sp. LEGE 07088]|uniref:hypothetical protein n=1 Tax=Nodosilinea sp. LEGE 07088 TaxID=2777968 RepID=UPI001881AC88|nr:hypothetical protein [Nodosilinea sp. LEGE 07088]MBE9138101.1 hypothetical protein [Nodosilinea sp. LEGE 07088]